MLRKLSLALFALVVATESATETRAQLIVTISDNGPSTLWTFSGSSTVIASDFVPSGNAISVQASANIFNNPIFDDFVGYVPSAPITYSVNGNPVGIIDLIQISNATLWYFSLDNAVLYSPGDIVSWSGSATLNFPNSRLIHDVTGTPTTQPTIGLVTTSSVPEPSSLPLAGVVTGVVATWRFARRRWARVAGASEIKK